MISSIVVLSDNGLDVLADSRSSVVKSSLIPMNALIVMESPISKPSLSIFAGPVSDLVMVWPTSIYCVRNPHCL